MSDKKQRKPKLLMADLFCGAGGSSTGAMKALSALGYEVVLTCCNHWPVAIETHKKNHPEARHYCQDVATLHPSVAVPEGKLHLLMASPSCVYHSRARGGKPTSDQQRQDPWHVISWLTDLRVDCFIAENVPEFSFWGPISKVTGKPIKSRQGEYFQAWINTLNGLGFKAEWKILNSANYGDATTRERFFLIARSDGKPIRWPEPTHFKNPEKDLFGEKKKWRSAREIIDWSTKGKSIFDRKKPLAQKTLARLMTGAKKFSWPEPFQVVLRNHADARSIDDPLPCITAGGKHVGVAEQTVTPFVLAQGSTGAPRDVKYPLPTIVGAGAISITEATAMLLEVNHADGDSPRTSRSIDSPLPTITSKRGVALAEAMIVNMKGASSAMDIDKPVPTITAHAKHLAVAETFCNPLPMISPYYGSGSGHTCKGVDEPLDTITTKARFAMAEPFAEPVTISRHSKGGSQVAAVIDPCLITVSHAMASRKTPHGEGRMIYAPVPTITASAIEMGVAEAILDPFIVPQFGERNGQLPRVHSVDAPIPTVTGHGAGAVVEAVMDPLIVQTDQTGSNGGCVRSCDTPLYTIVTKQNQALVQPILNMIDKKDKGSLLKAIDQGRLVLIDGQPYLLDIRFRMLMNKELARAMSFSDDETEYEFVGTSTEITKQIGNAVPVETACALVSANFQQAKENYEYEPLAKKVA